jgi:hypothetical protein
MLVLNTPTLKLPVSSLGTCQRNARGSSSIIHSRQISPRFKRLVGTILLNGGGTSTANCTRRMQSPAAVPKEPQLNAKAAAPNLKKLLSPRDDLHFVRMFAPSRLMPVEIPLEERGVNVGALGRHYCRDSAVLPAFGRARPSGDHRCRRRADRNVGGGLR